MGPLFKQSRLTAVAAGLVFVLTVCAIVVGSRWRVARERAEERSERIEVRLSVLAADLHREFPQEVVDRIYSCAGGRGQVPCPAYVATVRFSEAGPSEQPRLEPAYKADGTVAIGLRASDFAVDRCPSDLTCNHHWSAQITAGEGVLLFAHVSTFNGEWMGPRWLHPAHLTAGITTYFEEPSGYIVKILAVDTDPAVTGKPLADELLGH